MRYLKHFAAVCLAALVFGCFLFALGRLDDGRQDQSSQQLERSLRRAIAACYASTGAYPESLSFLVEEYGIQIDESRYHVFYMPVAENLPPELDIVELGVDAE